MEEVSLPDHKLVSGSDRASGQRVDSPTDFAAAAHCGPSRRAMKTATPARASARVIATTPTFSKGSCASLRLISRSNMLQRQPRYLPRRAIATTDTGPEQIEHVNSWAPMLHHPLAKIDRGILHTRCQTASLPHNKKLKC